MEEREREREMKERERKKKERERIIYLGFAKNNPVSEMGQV
jgi:hypothetical protein